MKHLVLTDTDIEDAERVIQMADYLSNHIENSGLIGHALIAYAILVAESDRSSQADRLSNDLASIISDHAEYVKQ